MYIQVTSVIINRTIGHLIDWRYSKYPTETVNCRTIVIDTQTVTVFIAIHFKAAIILIENLRPAMQLCIVFKAPVFVDKVTHLLFELLVTEHLCIYQPFAQQLSDLHGCKCIPQVIGGFALEIVKDLIGQSFRIGLSLCQYAQAFTGHSVLMAVHP